MKTTAAWTKSVLASAALAILAIAITGSPAHAGHKCPDRYFKKQKLTGVDPQKEDAAKKATPMGFPPKPRNSNRTATSANAKTRARNAPTDTSTRKPPSANLTKRKTSSSASAGFVPDVSARTRTRCRQTEGNTSHVRGLCSTKGYRRILVSAGSSSLMLDSLCREPSRGFWNPIGR